GAGMASAVPLAHTRARRRLSAASARLICSDTAMSCTVQCTANACPDEGAASVAYSANCRQPIARSLHDLSFDKPRMHVLWIATKAPWPAIDGGRLVMALTIDALIDAGVD